MKNARPTGFPDGAACRDGVCDPMKTLNVPLPGREYEIVIQKGCLAEAGERCRRVLKKAVRAAVVTDSNVAGLYGEQVVESLRKVGLESRLIVIPAGESSKNMAMLEHLYDELLAFGTTRTDALVALGGGVVGDLAGFAAATLLRGIDFVQIPTTLLAQVDSSVGGKVAVDLKAGKNLAGAFWQPKLVVMDPEVLNTLPDKVFSDGMAEVIKYGCIADEGFFRLLENCGGRVRVMEHIETVLHTCCAIKANVVLEDERDTGRRMLLNFGHTLGHAYEKAGHYEIWTHGQAVAAGMCAAAEVGRKLGVTPEDVPEKIRTLVTAYGLPAHIACSAEDYEAAIGTDKKGAGNDISLILLEEMGRACARKMPKKTALELLEGCEQA